MANDKSDNADEVQPLAPPGPIHGRTWATIHGRAFEAAYGQPPQRPTARTWQVIYGRSFDVVYGRSKPF